MTAGRAVIVAMLWLAAMPGPGGIMGGSTGGSGGGGRIGGGGGGSSGAMIVTFHRAH